VNPYAQAGGASAACTAIPVPLIAPNAKVVAAKNHSLIDPSLLLELCHPLATPAFHRESRKHIMAPLGALRLGSIVGHRARGLLSRWQRVALHLTYDKARAKAYRWARTAGAVRPIHYCIGSAGPCWALIPRINGRSILNFTWRHCASILRVDRSRFACELHKPSRKMPTHRQMRRSFPCIPRAQPDRPSVHAPGRACARISVRS
jgi:hypothetical protein